MIELSHAQIVAVAKCIPDKIVDVAKQSLGDGSAADVDFKVRIVGNVTKGMATLSVEGESKPTVSLRSLPHFCAILKACGIGVGRLSQALDGLDKSPTADEALEACFAAEESKRSRKLKPIKTTTPGRAGAVKCAASVTLLK